MTRRLERGRYDSAINVCDNEGADPYVTPAKPA